MIEYGPAHGLQWTQSIIILTSNVGASKAAQIANERAEVRWKWKLSSCCCHNLCVSSLVGRQALLPLQNL
jgi:hypothetical protein